jgi:hypothetical protein
MLIVGVHVGACREGNELRNHAVSLETAVVRNLLEDYVVNELPTLGGYIMLDSPWSNSI